MTAPSAKVEPVRRDAAGSSMPFESERHRLVRIARMFATGDWSPLVYALWLRWRGLEYSNADYVLPKDGHLPQNSGGPVLAKVIRSLRVPKGSVVLDLGVGMGLAAITLSRYFKLVIGVDHSPDLIAAAKRNVTKMGIDNIQLHCADARVFSDGLDQVTHVYMFNPFPESVMTIVMGNLRRSLTCAPRRLTIIYMYPFCHTAILAAGFVHKRNLQFRRSHRFAIYEA
jgi:SAM-dependent methyltransferase